MNLIDDDGVVDSTALDEFIKGEGDEFNGSEIVVEEADPGPNQDADDVDFEDIDGSVEAYYDDASNNLYLVVNEDTLEGTGNLEDVEDGDEFDVTFNLKDNRLLDYDLSTSPVDYDGDEDEVEDEYQTLETTMTIEDRDASFDVTEVDDTDYVVVGAAADQTISGTTNIAPGSEVSIRAQGTGDARFVEEITGLVVQEDGSFSATFDFSDVEVGSEFEAELRGDLQGDDDGDNFVADGLVQEAQPTETTEPPATTTEPTPTTEEPTPTTEEPTPTTEEPTPTPTPTETTTETPGFTMGLALVALLGAALLALRRDN